MRRFAGLLAALLVATALASGASAFTYAEWQYGDVISTIDGRQLALGGAGLASADGARGAMLNPALVAKAEGLEVAVTAAAINTEESREIPLHDSFDGIIGYNTYAMNSALYDRYFGTIAYKPSGDFEWAPAVAIGYRPRLDMSYDYHVQYRDNDTQTEPMDRIKWDDYAIGEGGISAFTVALGQEVADEVYVGIGVDFLRGDYDVRHKRVFPTAAARDDSTTWAAYDDVSGTQFSIGVLVETLHRLDIAVVYRPGFELKGDYALTPAAEDTATEAVACGFDYTYPDAIALGLEYHPRNELMTTVSFDVEYTRWSEFEDGLGENPDFDDTIEFRFGVEHSFYDKTSARFGFQYAPSYMDERYSRAAFSAGLGMDILGVRADIGGQIGLREYDIDEGRIRETTMLGMATLTHRF